MIDPSPGFSPNPDGKPNYTVDGKPLHSRNNPEEEARRFIAGILSQHPTGNIIIAGVGAGYVFEILRHLPTERVFFLEPIGAIRERLLEVAPPGSRILASIEDLPSGPAQIFPLPGHRARFPVAHAAINEYAKSLSREPADSRIDRATTARFFRRWSRNFFHSLFCDGLEFISQPVKNSGTVLFCGAGPTLFDDLEQLDISRATLCAADTALAPMLRRGIIPHYVISVDSGYGTLYHLKAAARAGLGQHPEITAVTWSGGHPALSLFFRRRIHFLTTFPLDQIVSQGILSNLPVFENESRNTAGIAVRLAWSSGSNLAFAGTHFRSQAGLSHIPGTGYDLFASESQSRIKPISQYRPGGYSSDLTARNRSSLEGVKAMAGMLGVSIESQTRGATHAFPVLSQDPRAIARFLLDQWGRIDWTILESFGLQRPEFNKWKSVCESRLSSI